MHCRGSCDHYVSKSDWLSGDGDASLGTTSGSMAELLSARLVQSTRLTARSSASIASRTSSRERMQQQQQQSWREPRVPAVLLQWGLLQQLKRRLQVIQSEMGLRHVKIGLPQDAAAVHQPQAAAPLAKMWKCTATQRRSVATLPRETLIQSMLSPGLQVCSVNVVGSTFPTERCPTRNQTLSAVCG